MRRVPLCLLFSVVMCALGGTLAWAAAPLIVDFTVERGRDIAVDGTISYHERYWVTASDDDGASDIESVMITDSGGTEYVIDRSGGPGISWTDECDDAFTACIQWEKWELLVPPPPGPYGVTVTDLAANYDSCTTSVVPEVPEISPQLLTPAPDNPLIPDTVPTFSWTAGAAGTTHTIHVFEDCTGELVWHQHLGDQTSTLYNFDESATQPELIPAHIYRWQIEAWVCHDDRESHPAVRTFTDCFAFGRFTVQTLSLHAPVIEDVCIGRGQDTDAPDWACYHECMAVWVRDDDGACNIASVTIIDPVGTEYTITPSEGGSWWQDDDYTIGCWRGQWRLADPPTPGSYTVTVLDQGELWDSLTTPATSDAAVGTTEPLSPPMESVIDETIPTFEWTTPSLPCAYYALHLEEEGTLGEIWSPDLGERCDPIVQVTYDFDETALRPQLQPNHAYFWRIDTWGAEDDRVSDPRVILARYETTRARFTVYGDWPEIPPDLPGKLAYSAVPWAADVFWSWGMSRVVLYDTDPNSRTWLQSDWTWSVEWCADGTKLLFVKEPGVWVDYLDGTDPVQIPNLPSWGWARWAPDGDRVVFQFWGPENPDLPQNYDIWVTDIDGTNPYPLVESFDSRDQFPAWSPDGLWIAYLKSPDPEGVCLHLVRYDGTEDHTVVAAGVVGHPEYQVDYMGDASWSPDGKRLAIAFSANLPGALSEADGWICGVGTIPPEGGLLAPLFVAPPAVICCAAPRGPAWSPDGTQIVFASAHHLAPEELPGVEEFCPSVELWLVNANGLGDAIRLTYDYSFNVPTSWWARNTEPGAGVSVTKGDTSVRFETVTDSGSTTVCVTDEPPGPTPSGFQFLGDYYDISTTATLEPGSSITIEIHYDDADVPGGEEEWLSLLHWETDHWVDITVRPIDTVNNIITGQCTSLSEFGIAFGPQLAYPLPPINSDGSSVFKLNRTVPVKFQLIATDGSYVSDAVARLYVEEFSTEVTGTVEEPGTTAEADTGYVFRYDPDANQYVYNLGTKNLDIGTWTLMVVANEMPPKQVQISLR